MKNKKSISLFALTLLMVGAVDGVGNLPYLPARLGDENQHGVPVKILMLQGVVVSFISLVFFLLPSINGSYWLLLDLSTELYIAMYVLMFIAAIKLSFDFNKTKVIPGGKYSAITLSVIGLLGCLITFVVGFFPLDGINVGSHWHYTLLFAGGLMIMMSPALLLTYHKKKKHKMLMFA